MTLGACSPFGSDSHPKFALPELPKDLRVCFNQVVPAPKGTTLSQQQVFDKIAELHQSDVRKTNCGKRLIAWYDGLHG